MAKTNWQDPGASEILSTHISGLQDAVSKIENVLDVKSTLETDMELSYVTSYDPDTGLQAFRIFQAPEGKRNWLQSPSPIVKKNDNVITDDFTIDYGGGAIIFSVPVADTDVITVDATYTISVSESLNDKVSNSRVLKDVPADAEFTDTTYDPATTLEDGLMSNDDKKLLLQLESNHDVEKSPIGFPSRLDSVITFNKTTREFKIEPTGSSFNVHYKNKVYTYDGPQTVIIPNVTGVYFIYFNKDTGVLETSTSFPGLDQMIYVSYVYWNTDQATAERQFSIGDERHGTDMPPATHAYLHEIIGAEWVRGLQIYGYTVDSDVADADLKLSITGGDVRDEDLTNKIRHSNSPGDNFEQILENVAKLPVMYRVGTDGAWKQDVATDFPFKNTPSGRMNYNKLDGNTWTQEQVPDGDFVAYYIVYTGLIEEPIKVIQGQRTDEVLDDAMGNNDYRDIVWGDLPFQEFKVLYRLIYRTKNTFSGTTKSKLKDVLDLRANRRTPSGGGGGPTVTDHSNLTGLGFAESGHTGFASSADLDAKAETTTYTATITTTDWDEVDDHYEQEIEVVGMLDTDNPIVDILLAGASDIDEATDMLTAWGNIYRIATEDDTIIVYSTDETETEIEIQLKVVK